MSCKEPKRSVSSGRKRKTRIAKVFHMKRSTSLLFLDEDKAARRNLYKKLGLPEDDSVK